MKSLNPKVYPLPFQTSKMERFTKKVNDEKSLTTFAKPYVLDI